jgi:hypothetical protein
MSDSNRPRKEYPADPNFAGAFAGGPPLLTAEEAKRLIDDPEGVEREIRERWQKILQKRAAEAKKIQEGG